MHADIDDEVNSRAPAEKYLTDDIKHVRRSKGLVKDVVLGRDQQPDALNARGDDANTLGNQNHQQNARDFHGLSHAQLKLGVVDVGIHHGFGFFVRLFQVHFNTGKADDVDDDEQRAVENGESVEIFHAEFVVRDDSVELGTHRMLRSGIAMFVVAHLVYDVYTGRNEDEKRHKGDQGAHHL